jgi:hypothetical protein
MVSDDGILTLGYVTIFPSGTSSNFLARSRFYQTDAISEYIVKGSPTVTLSAAELS